MSNEKHRFKVTAEPMLLLYSKGVFIGIYIGLQLSKSLPWWASIVAICVFMAIVIYDAFREGDTLTIVKRKDIELEKQIEQFPENTQP